MKTLVGLACISFSFSIGWSEGQEERKPFPDWAFCVAYQIRDPDQRDARPINPNAERDPFNEGDTEIPLSVLDHQNIVDVAALSMRAIKSAIIKQKDAARVIKGSTQGVKWHPIIESMQPRHLFVFYQYGGEPVAAIEVDFEYNRVRMEPEIRPAKGRRGPFESADLADLAGIAVAAGLDLKPFAPSLDDYVERLKRQDARSERLFEELKQKREAEKKSKQNKYR